MPCTARFRTQYRVKASERQTISLKRLLGDLGRESFVKTLKSLASGASQANLSTEAAGQVAWKYDGARDTYNLDLQGRSLPESLRSLSAERLQVAIRIGDGQLTLEHSLTMRTGSVSDALKQEAARQTNRAVNMVLALSVAEQLQIRMANHVQQSVQVQVSSALDVRAVAAW